MTEEPIYTFVKGKGWIVTNTESITITMGGKLYSLEHRKPEIDEYYSGSSFNSRWWDPAGNHPDWYVWREWATSVGSFSIRKQITFHSTLDFWVTLVPHD